MKPQDGEEWERDALDEVRRWALGGARFADDFAREFGFETPAERGRQDAYRAVLGIIDRCEARAFHGQRR